MSSQNAAAQNITGKKDIEFNPVFERALELMQAGEKNIFLTGRAGTGKSTLLDYFCRHAEKMPVILAPTGVAALNVKGQTIHSFFNFYIDVTPESIREKKHRPRDPKLYKKIKTIIIDEISMVRADLMDCIDEFLRLYGPVSDQPFGGVQMIFVGDLYQLPPVVGREEKALFDGALYRTPYFFSARAFRKFDLELVELDKVYRQRDQSFIALLNRIRNNSVESEDLEHLNSRHLKDFEPPEEAFYIHLTTTNKMADEINDEKLSELEGKMHTAHATIKGDVGKEYFPTATALQFKIGAQIMLLNNDPKRRWVNGSIGVIERVTQDKEGEEVLKVRLQDTRNIITVSKFMWEVYKFTSEDKEIKSEAVGTFTQYPFRLAWAVTIHKSQGKTFDRVVLDIGRGTFAAGQLYVGLSRCTSFEGLILKTPVQKRHVMTDARIFKFLTHFHYKKAEDEMPLTEKIAFIQKAVEEKAVLNVVYLKTNDTRSIRTVIPLRVGEENYHGRKFPGMTAYCTERHERRMFHVGRILEMSESEKG